MKRQGSVSLNTSFSPEISSLMFMMCLPVDFEVNSLERINVRYVAINHLREQYIYLQFPALSLASRPR